MKTKPAVLLCVLLVLALLLPACAAPRHDVEELRAALTDLLPRSAELNEIYFGRGLPTARDANAVRAFYESFDTDVASISYTVVDPECGYRTIDDIKAATLAVFTEDYAATLFDRAFTGISAVYNEGADDEFRSTAVYAMYLEQDGFLTVRVDLAKDALPLGREYDLSSLEIVRENAQGVLIRLASRREGQQQDVELWLVETADGWRLDSPTY